MKTAVKTRFLLRVLIVGVTLALAGQVTAQTFTTLHSFEGDSDGANPHAALVSSANTLYGTAQVGGSSGWGTVFKVNTDGTGFTTLHNFGALFRPFFTNSDGAYPQAALILSGETLYGTARIGGSLGGGTVFSVSTDGTGFTVQHSFSTGMWNPSGGGYTNNDGEGPSGLVLSGNTLYGAAEDGGSSGAGTVFAVNTDGTGFTNLHSFTTASSPLYINSDGFRPVAGLILSGNTLYGTASMGGGSGSGTVFAVNTDGTGFTTLYSFTPAAPGTGFNRDGAAPSAGLVLSGSTLYGTTAGGGSSDWGTVFAVNTDGTDFRKLADVGYYADLILLSNSLYGTTAGSVYKVNLDGTGFTTLYSFTATSDFSPYNNSDGFWPMAGLTSSGNILYGTAYWGGTSGNGTVFSLTLPPQLRIIPSGANAVLTWPITATGFTLQSTTNLASPVWTTNSPAPIIVNGQNTVTNPVFGTQQFFRLSQ